MSTHIKINQAADHVGQDVTLTGWVQKRVDKDESQFISPCNGSSVEVTSEFWAPTVDRG